MRWRSLKMDDGLPVPVTVSSRVPPSHERMFMHASAFRPVPAGMGFSPGNAF